MSKRNEQEERILDLLKSHKRLELTDVCETMQISEATARRYFSSLEERGVIIRTHGGALLREATSQYSYSDEAALMVPEKHAIAEKAASLIQDGEHLFLDTGTTLNEFGCAIGNRLGDGLLKDISIVTNSLMLNESLANHCSITLTGGRIRPSRQDLAGSVAMATISSYRFDRAILGADGIDADGTLYTTDEDTAALAKLAIGNAVTVMILADSSKLGRRSYVAYAKLSVKNMILITDNGAKEQFLKHLKDQGIRTILAD